MAEMTIGALAKAGAVGVETIRYYQRRKLLAEPARADGSGQEGGGVRHYGADTLQRLQFIRAAQRAGFTLEQIAELLALDAATDPVRLRELTEARLADLEARIEDLRTAKRALRRLERRCAERAPGPSPIVAAFASVSEARS